MNYKISFKERAKLAKEVLYKQPPVTLEEMWKQVEWIKKASERRIEKEKREKFNLQLK